MTGRCGRLAEPVRDRGPRPVRGYVDAAQPDQGVGGGRRAQVRVVRVSEEAAAEAMALMYRSTHNLPEPAGSLALAGLLAEKDRVAGTRVAVVHTGGNADFGVLARALS